MPPGAAPREHRLVAISRVDQPEDEPGAEVVFLPENQAERAILSGIAYECFEKEQISYIFVPVSRESAQRLRTLARVRI